MSIAKGSAQYRHRYAEPESGLASLFPGLFDFVMVVPVCAESPAFVNGYRTAASSAGRLLVVVVLNGRAGADDSVHTLNAECFSELHDRFSLREIGRGGWLGCDESMSLLVVDRFTSGRRFPSRQGVGLARKIGADVALELVATGRVRHPFIAMTDADASVPEDYFRRIAEIEPNCAAALFPFWHEPGGEGHVDRATALYEIRLRYVQRGLQWAHSPYAFHTVGSAMAVHALSYAQVRGVPKRQAAEDFYLLGKLSKQAPLTRLSGAPVRIRSRLSNRVPFGTGAETGKLARGGDLELYHPDCFAALQDLIGGLRWLSTTSPDPEAIEALLSGMRSPVQDFLRRQDVLRIWPKLGEQAPSSAARLGRFSDWFDGFRTLKMIHYVRDYGATSLPWKDAVRLAPFMNDIEDDGACLSGPRRELLRLEQALPRLVGPRLPPLDHHGFPRSGPRDMRAIQASATGADST